MFRRLIVILVAAVACLLPASESVSATASIAGGAYTYDATIEQRVDACTRALDLDSALARGAWEGVAGTTTVDAAPFTYDVPTISRAKAHDFDDAPASPARLGDAPEGSAPLSHLARGASTTPSTFSSATEAEIPGTIYREGAPSPSNLRVRPGEDALSFRDSLSNPWPLAEGQRPVFRPGEPYFGVETAKLPPGSVVPDGVPPGHVSVIGVDPGVIKDAVIQQPPWPRFPK